MGTPIQGDAYVIAQTQPTPTPGGGYAGDRINSAQVEPGDALAVRELPVSIYLVKAQTVRSGWTAPYNCRLRAVKLLNNAAAATDGAGKDLTIFVKNITSGVEVLSDGAASGIVYDASPSLAASTASVLTSGTPAAATSVINSAAVENVKKDDSFLITVAASNDANWDYAHLTVVFVIEPQIADTSKTTQADRTYQPALRSKDS